jgi:hypothetical protein
VRAGVGLLLLTAAACSIQRNGDGGRDDFAGCYQFRWDAAAAEMRLPWGFDLLEEPLEGWGNVPDGRVARTRTTERTMRDQPFAFWRRAGQDSIRVGHPGGGGLSLSLARQGPDLVGTARTLGDAIPLGEPPPPITRPIVAYRVLCPA